jgi:hypothetical protein
LTNIDSASLVAGANGILTLPNVTSYAVGTGFSDFLATGVNSKLDLTALTSITGTMGGLDIEALSGGTIELDGIASTAAKDLDFEVDGATSVLNLSSMTSVSDSMASGAILIENGGTLIAPALASYNGGTITVNNHSVSLSQLTNIDNSSLTAGANGIFTLPNVTSYALPASGSRAFAASGANARLDLTALTSITGTTGGLDVNALSGGTVELDGLASTTARDLDLVANGASSVLVITALGAWSDSTNLSSLTATNSGTVNLTAAAATFTGVPVTVSTSGVINVGTLQLNPNSSISGDSTLNGNLMANYFVRPGTSPGRLTVTGDHTQGATGTLLIEINGLTVATQYDQLRTGGDVSVSGVLSLSGTYQANVGDSFTIVDNTGPNPISGTFANRPQGSFIMLNAAPLQISYTGGDGNDVTLTRLANLVSGRKLFYNQSAFDGNSASINTLDDSAIATDKSAYLPGAGVAVYNNISNYSRGINGIMIDIAGTGTHTSINANDFVFKVGNNNSPSTWATAPAPAAISVRTGAGTSGSDRVEITWAANAVKNTWLEVQVLATANTGLPATDVFFWGNRVGDVTSPASGVNFITNVSGDGSLVAGASPASNVGITSLYDVNRSNTINVAGDRADVIANAPGSLLRINIGTGGPFAPQDDESDGTGGGGDAGIASALAVPASDSSDQSSWLPASERGTVPFCSPTILRTVPDRKSGQSPAALKPLLASVYEQWGEATEPDDDDALDASQVDEELLELLSAGL